MNGELDRLQHETARDMELLRALPACAPRRACVERIKQAIAAEAARVTRTQRRLDLLRGWGGAAAALLLAVLFATTTSPKPPISVDPEAALDEWASAWDESSGHLTSLLDGGWIDGAFGNGYDNGAEVDELFESLDQTLDQFEAF